MHTIFSGVPETMCIVQSFADRYPKFIIVITSRERERECERETERERDVLWVHFNRIRFQFYVHDWPVCNNNHGVLMQVWIALFCHAQNASKAKNEEWANKPFTEEKTNTKQPINYRICTDWLCTASCNFDENSALNCCCCLLLSSRWIYSHSKCFFLLISISMIFSIFECFQSSSSNNHFRNTIWKGWDFPVEDRRHVTHTLNFDHSNFPRGDSNVTDSDSVIQLI